MRHAVATAYLNYELLDGGRPSIKKIAIEQQVSRTFVRKIEGKLKNGKVPNLLVLLSLLPSSSLPLFGSVTSIPPPLPPPRPPTATTSTKGEGGRPGSQYGAFVVDNGELLTGLCRSCSCCIALLASHCIALHSMRLCSLDFRLAHFDTHRSASPHRRTWRQGRRGGQC